MVVFATFRFPLGERRNPIKPGYSLIRLVVIWLDWDFCVGRELTLGKFLTVTCRCRHRSLGVAFEGYNDPWFLLLALPLGCCDTNSFPICFYLQNLGLLGCRAFPTGMDKNPLKP